MTPTGGPGVAAREGAGSGCQPERGRECGAHMAWAREACWASVRRKVGAGRLNWASERGRETGGEGEIVGLGAKRG